MCPVPPSFKDRRQLRGSLTTAALDERIVEIPKDLDWSYFQSAPRDQRIELLRGDEWVLLKGLSQGGTVLRSRLPGVTALMRRYRHGQCVAKPIPMRADMLQIRPDTMQCTITWRASLPLPNERAAEGLALVGALQMPGEAVDWPASTAELKRSNRALATATDAPLQNLQTTIAMADEGAQPSSAVTDLAGTYVLSAEQVADAAAEAAAPFPLRSPSSLPAPTAEATSAIPGAPWAQREAGPSDDGARESEAARADGDAAKAEQRRLEDAKVEQQRLEAARAEQLRLEAEQAEARRKAEAKRFEAEQRAARAADEARAAEKLQDKRTRAKKIKASVGISFYFEQLDATARRHRVPRRLPNDHASVDRARLVRSPTVHTSVGAGFIPARASAP